MRVLLADADPDVRRALRIFLAHDQVGMQVVGEVVEATDLWPRVQGARPDLLLLEWGLLGAGVVAALAGLRVAYPHLQVMVLSGHPEVRRHALAAGADAFVSKADSPEQMLETLRAARGAAGRADDARRATTEGAGACTAEGADE